MEKKVKEIKAGQKYELAVGVDMWKDDISGVFLKAPSKIRISSPHSDYRSKLDWFNSKRFNKNPDSFLYEKDPGNMSFEIKKGMDISRIKVAISKGILVPKGKAKRVLAKGEPKKIWRNDNVSGEVIYDGPNKFIYTLMQKHVTKLVPEIEKVKDPRHLEIMLEMEQKGWNPTCAPRRNVTEVIEKQLKDESIGISTIVEEENEISNLGDEIKNK